LYSLYVINAFPFDIFHALPIKVEYLLNYTEEIIHYLFSLGVNTLWRNESPGYLMNNGPHEELELCIFFRMVIILLKIISTCASVSRAAKTAAATT